MNILTDSAIISLDGWYQYVKPMCIGIDMKIKTSVAELDKLLDGEKEFTSPSGPVNEEDFLDDQSIEDQKYINPMIIAPQEGLKFSIINLMSHCLTRLVNDYMERYCKNSNSDSNRTCMITLKNEFLKIGQYDSNVISESSLIAGNSLRRQSAAKIKNNSMEVFICN